MHPCLPQHKKKLSANKSEIKREKLSNEKHSFLAFDSRCPLGAEIHGSFQSILCRIPDSGTCLVFWVPRLNTFAQN
ncbi:hypothetical protein CAL7102_08273 [Dulcicalothrix desertica PCC 7102]|nr:hypothetical protein CAL7102_08273 [Dulcicalothrix desertica PCC 7102]